VGDICAKDGAAPAAKANVTVTAASGFHSFINQ
jgi:hypothetical protein